MRQGRAWLALYPNPWGTYSMSAKHIHDHVPGARLAGPGARVDDVHIGLVFAARQQVCAAARPLHAAARAARMHLRYSLPRTARPYEVKSTILEGWWDAKFVHQRRSLETSMQNTWSGQTVALE